MRAFAAALAVTAVAVYTFAWTIIQVSAFFGTSFPDFSAMGVFGHYILVVHAAAAALVIHMVRRASPYALVGGAPAHDVPHQVEREQPDIDSIVQPLVDAIELAHTRGRQQEVIRFGAALSRPLFVNGNHAARLKIGRLVEEATNLSGARSIQAEMLVDAIGWSEVELGDLNAAERSIQHGLKVAMELGDDYRTARAYRHLGAIERRRSGPPNYGAAKRYFELAIQHSTRLLDGPNRWESLAGSHYAIASLKYHTADYLGAVADLTTAIKWFEQCGDSIGITRSMTKQAEALEALGRRHEAKDLLRRALSLAEQDTHRNQIMRASIGLARILVSEFEFKKAVQHLRRARQLAEDMNVVAPLEAWAKVVSEIPLEHRKTLEE